MSAGEVVLLKSSTSFGASSGDRSYKKVWQHVQKFRECGKCIAEIETWMFLISFLTSGSGLCRHPALRNVLISSNKFVLL